MFKKKKRKKVICLLVLLLLFFWRAGTQESLSPDFLPPSDGSSSRDSMGCGSHGPFWSPLWLCDMSFRTGQDSTLLLGPRIEVVDLPCRLSQTEVNCAAKQRTPPILSQGKGKTRGAQRFIQSRKSAEHLVCARPALGSGSIGNKTRLCPKVRKGGVTRQENCVLNIMIMK